MSDVPFENRYARYLHPHWQELKARVRRHCANLCEFCCLREIKKLHHRNGYLAPVGSEKFEEVMGVCDECHEYIHGFVSQLIIGGTSLAFVNDSGHGIDGSVWRHYLACGRNPQRPRADNVWALHHDGKLTPVRPPA